MFEGYLQISRAESFASSSVLELGFEVSGFSSGVVSTSLGASGTLNPSGKVSVGDLGISSV